MNALPAADAAARPAEEVVRDLEPSAERGLGAAEAQKRLGEVGPNVLDRAPGESAWKILWRQVNTPLIWELMSSSVLAFVVGERVDTFVVLAPEVRLT